MAWAKDSAQKTRAPKTTLAEDMRKILFDKPPVLPGDIPSCCMVYGQDGTGKSGLALSTLTEQDVKDGKKIVVIDLDSGNIPLILEHHREAFDKGAIKYLDPTVWGEDENGSPILDYKKTMDIINAVAIAAKEEWQENQNIKAIIFDGGSKLLKYSEAQMRLQKHLDADGGVQLRYWILRNKMFLETLELYKTLPFDKYFIFHDDFALTTSGDKMAAVKVQAHQLMFQKIYCERNDLGPRVQFTATIEKSKFDILAEGKRIVFGEVNKTENNYQWRPNKVLRELRKENKNMYPIEDDEVTQKAKKAVKDEKP